MARMLVASILSGCLSACSGLPDWALVYPSRNQPTADPISHYSFAWRLSGDRAVAPIQVFDNGRQTWLQFPPQRPLPAVFEHTTAGDRALHYKREGPYVVLDGVWPKLVLRGGRLQSWVEQLPVSSDLPVAASTVSSVTPTVIPVDASPATPAIAPAATSIATATADPEVAPATVQPDLQTAAQPPVQLPLNPALASRGSADSIALPASDMPDDSPQRYTVSPKDLNLRLALTRWAQSVGWTFESEHWAVDADIPIVASATFEPGFKPAVQDLVASTELADRPLRPCFYSNRVLRIVPYAQQCDRTVAGAGAS